MKTRLSCRKASSSSGAIPSRALADLSISKMNPKSILFLSLMGGIVLVVAVLVAISFDSIEYTQYGLDYASISKSVDQTPYSGGIYFLGIGHSFIKFPKTIQTIEFSNDHTSDGKLIQSRTLDGLEVELEISFQYQLISADLFDLYMSYALDYRRMIKNIAIDSLTDMATKYTAYNFFMERGRIGNEMQEALNTVLGNRTHCEVQFFQLRDVDLPDEFEDAIQLTEVKKQDIHKAQAEQNKVKIEIETKIITANMQKNVTINLAKGEANAIAQANAAYIVGFDATGNRATEGYLEVKKDLNLTNAKLLEYVKAKIIRKYKGGNLVISF